jgi:peptide/nickel transport system substrate-binding protein
LLLNFAQVPEYQVENAAVVNDDRPGMRVFRFNRCEQRLTALGDCVASIRRWGVRDTFGQTLMQRTHELSAPDDRTIVFRLKKPFALLPDALGHFCVNMCAIMPERLANTDPFKQVTEVIGSGPFGFKADEYVQGSLYVYERFRDYKPREDGEADMSAGPKIVHFDRVEWHINQDQAIAAAALQSGEVDWLESPIPDLLPLLKQHAKITTVRRGSIGDCALLRPNHLLPPFDNPAVRRALMGAIDQTEFMTASEGTDPTLWRVPAGFFPPRSSMASDEGLAALTGTQDYAKVRRDLEAAGYRGEKIALIVAADLPRIKAWSDVAAEMLHKVGMDVDYQPMDLGTMVQRRTSKKPADQGDWNALCTSFQGVELLSPAIHQLLRCNGEQASFGWPSSPTIEALRDRWFDAPDLSAQKKICAEIQAQAFIDVPYYPIGAPYFHIAYRSNLTGVIDGQSIFSNVRRQSLC